MVSLAQQIKDQARTLGFDLVGIAPASEAETFTQYEEWLEAGFAGEMTYLHRHAEARRHPSAILPHVRSVVMVAMNYKQPANSTAGIASYAIGNDYHDVLRARLKQLLSWIHEHVPECHGRAVVDSAPLLERDFARRAGLGWFGKNTMLLNRELGSFFFLAALLLDIELPPDQPHESSHCGTCTACLDACPTNAFPQAGQMDARRCISYLTIEHRGSIAIDLRSQMGEWIFGCDICQDVCPWNRKPPVGNEPQFAERPELENIDWTELLTLSEEQFRERFRGTALTRPGRSGLLRNAAIALGNRGDPSAIPALTRALDDADPTIRDAAAWAIKRIEDKLSDGA